MGEISCNAFCKNEILACRIDAVFQSRIQYWAHAEQIIGGCGASVI
jgi:hypothetical protein